MQPQPPQRRNAFLGSISGSLKPPDQRGSGAEEEKLLKSSGVLPIVCALLARKPAGAAPIVYRLGHWILNPVSRVRLPVGAPAFTPTQRSGFLL